LEDERIYPFGVKDLNLILDVYFENFPENKNKPIYLFLDEIQEVKDWEIFIRRILDETNINIVLT
jgi:predicted AAA+ superfamily ATPase